MSAARAAVADLPGDGQPVELTGVLARVPAPRMVVAAPRVVAVVAERFGVPVEQLRGRGRTRPVAAARHTAMYLCRTLSGLSLPAIGAEFDRDHSTVLSGIRQVEGYRDQDETWQVLLRGLTAQLRAWEQPADVRVPAPPVMLSAPVVPRLVVLECPVCLLTGDGPVDVAAAVQLAGTHDDLLHRGEPVTVVRAVRAAGGAR